jgi:phosphate transport system protein
MSRATYEPQVDDEPPEDERETNSPETSDCRARRFGARDPRRLRENEAGPTKGGTVPEVRRGFTEDLERLQLDVVRLGALALEAVHRGSEALLAYDLGAVDETIAHDGDLDHLSDSIEERIYVMLATQAPVAADLRAMVTMLRVNHELERIGDYMVNVAKATRRLQPEPLDPRVLGILDQMRNQASAQLEIAVDAFAQRDPTQVSDLPAMDDVMDDLTRELFRTIFTMSVDHDEAIQRAVQLALVGRYYERVADHAVNVGGRVDYMVTGHFHEHPTGE